MADGRNRFDFSLQTVPDRWFDAAEESGQTDPTPLTRPRPDKAVPHGQRADPFAAFLAGTAMALAAGTGWFLLEFDGIISPWSVTVLGILIGTSVRLGAGPYDPAMRATVALVLFAVTAIVVSFLSVRLQLQVTNMDFSFAYEEREWLRRRIYDPAYAGCTALGAVLAARVNYIASNRR
jgi:hypothetical protein